MPDYSKNPIVIAINGWLIENYLKKFNENYLPNFEIVETSGFRTEEKNRNIGGAKDSAHVYNLARDYVLKNISTGKNIK